MRGQKGMLSEVFSRVPFVGAWPSHIPAGHLRITSAKAAAGVEIQSVSFRDAQDQTTFFHFNK